ncbi:MAG: permease-like cell division protein FtsX [Bacteroidota bacterium]
MDKSTPPPRQRPRYSYTIISVAAVLFLLGFFGMLLLQSQQLTRILKEQVDIIVEVEANTAGPVREALGKRLDGSPFVRAGSVRFTSREDALALMSDELGEDLLSLDLPNPLYDVFTFNTPARYLAADSLAAIRELLLVQEGVSDVYYQESLVDQLASNISRISWILLGVAVLFVLLALTVIHNTIRLDLYANRFLIKTQELVGATWEFISRPYLRKALWNGLISALLAVGLLIGLQWWMAEQLPEIRQLQHPLALGVLFVLLIVLGMLINWVSTYFVVRKYLNLREDELYQQ